MLLGHYSLQDDVIFQEISEDDEWGGGGGEDDDQSHTIKC